VALPPAGDDADPGGVEVATLAHAAVMAEIHRTAFSASEAWSRDVMLLQVELPGTFGLVHPAGGMILARVAADEAEILTLAVIPGQRRHGIGRALLRAATRRAEAMGAASMFLEVAVTNGAARALYATQGFMEAGIRRRYYADGTDALILRSTLQAGVIDS
jgi:ribosomal-protein-alanine N-acetyltransferase